MADDVDERPHVAAIIAAITAQLAIPEDGEDPNIWQAFDVDDPELTGDLPAIYVTVLIERRYGGRPGMSGAVRGVGWRITTRAVGTTIGEARWARVRIHRALEGRRLDVAGEFTTQIRFETERPIGEDDGRYAGSTEWTYAH
jgi:hypothetical protein